jgi:hypothetical protein
MFGKVKLFHNGAFISQKTENDKLYVDIYVKSMPVTLN